MKRKRISNVFNKLAERDGSTCYYCKDQPATTVDHILPWSWEKNNDLDNLVLACFSCNSIAGNQIFESLEHKAQYIRNKRQKFFLERAICCDCLLPYSYRTHSPSLFLCADCYDIEYDTHCSETEEWENWKKELSNAGILYNAYKYALKKAGSATGNNKDKFMKFLNDWYSYHFAEDYLGVNNEKVLV